MTVHGEPAAEIAPISWPRRRWLTREDLIAFIDSGGQADAGLTKLLEELAGDTTDDLDWPA